MIFNSLIFLLFWLAFTVFTLKSWRENHKYIIISGFSLFFYGFWRFEYIFLILVSGIIDFICGAKIYKSTTKKCWLYTSLISNLGILFSFKYFDFFVDVINSMGFSVSGFVEGSYFSVLPIGISFYTFQSMSYTIDIYRGDLKPTKNFLKFFSYLSMFPQLVAGPIVRARDILDQMSELKLQKGDELYYALKLIIYGFFKKIVIADGFAKYVNTAFVNPEYPESSAYWWSIAMSFAIQIYCDFSGYSDIARGLARMYGIHFPLNFNHPYIASSFKDFWGRWHISLSSWFRDYVYIPLGGSKKGRFRSHLNMWITMVTSGIWHGANYTFIIWGFLHAFFLSLERELDYFKFRLPVILKQALVLTGVLIAWMYFRAESFTQANEIVLRMLSFKGSSVSLGNTLSVLLLIMIGRELYVGKGILKSKIRKIIHPLEPIWVGVLAILSIFFRGDGDTFIYFQF